MLKGGGETLKGDEETVKNEQMLQRETRCVKGHKGHEGHKNINGWEELIFKFKLK